MKKEKLKKDYIFNFYLIDKYLLIIKVSIQHTISNYTEYNYLLIT